jgi:alpha-galactosidase
MEEADGEWQDDCAYCQNLNATEWCTNPRFCPKDYDYSTSKTAVRYNRMRDALAAVDRPILYSLCDWGLANVATWGNATGQSWRQTGDIEGKSVDRFGWLNPILMSSRHV